VSRVRFFWKPGITTSLLHHSTEILQQPSQISWLFRLPIRGKLQVSSANEILGNLAEKIAVLIEDSAIATEKLNAELQRSDKEGAKDNCAKIQHNLNNLADIAEQLAEYVGVEPPQSRRIDVNTTIMQECASFKEYCARKGIRLDFDLLSDTPKRVIDEMYLRKSLRALLTNAGEALQGVESGCIKISSEIDNRGELIVRVTDNGCGIRKDLLEKVYLPFFTTKGIQHSGIGLAMVEKFMESQGGRISVVSQPEVGSVVSMAFPAVDSNAAL